MNHDIDPVRPFDDPAREREWQAQERAAQRERLRLDPAADDARTQGYRLLARALKVAPPGGLPRDFAQRVDALAAQSAHGSAAQFETALTAALAVVLMASAVVATVLYGGRWLPAFTAWLPPPSIAQWLVALVGCLGLTWLVGAGFRLFADPANMDRG